MMMGTTPIQPVAPIEETVQHKTDVLDWGRLDGAPCELEYRLHFRRTLGDHLATVGLMMLAAVAAVPLAALTGAFVAPRIASWQVATIALGIGVIAALCQRFTTEAKRTSAIDTIAVTSAGLIFLLPLFVWFVVCLSAHAHELAGAFLFLTMAIPVGVVAADRIATHAVFWMTANGYLDYSTVHAWRADWHRRFVTGPLQDLADDDDSDADLRPLIQSAMRTRAAYVAGLLWVLAAVVVPNMAIMIINTPAAKTTLGLQLVVGTMFGLLMTALLRSGGSGRMPVRYWSVVSHYFHYDKRNRTTPWMFQSPCGGVGRRRFLPLVSVGLLSVSLSFLAADSLRSLTLSSRALPAVSTSHADQPVGDRMDSHDNTMGINASLTGRVLLMLACAALVAPTALFLLGFIVIGPLIDAYHEALET